MANNKLYGYTPDPSKEADGNRLDRLNPYEFKKGMDYELVNMGIARLAESTEDERQKATETVLKNLQEHGGYYSALIDYETRYRNVAEGQTKPSFKAYLKEMEDHHMIEVDKTFSHDKMVEPKYKKEDHTVQFKTDKMGSFKLKALKEAIKAEIKNHLEEENKDVINEAYKCICGNGASIGHIHGCDSVNGCRQCCKGKEGVSRSMSMTKSRNEDINEAKGDDFEEKEPTVSQIKGIDKSIGDAKEALAKAMARVKELAPDIKKLAKETNAKVKKNPAGKTDYLKTYTTNPDVKEFIKLRKMLKSADLL
tara:strand:- start:99 stop:1025 length:927 start_codon:yes stop_codon:yes gene_type:complete